MLLLFLLNSILSGRSFLLSCILSKAKKALKISPTEVNINKNRKTFFIKFIFKASKHNRYNIIAKSSQLSTIDFLKSNHIKLLPVNTSLLFAISSGTNAVKIALEKAKLELGF